jgi:hypothetical protein
MSLLGGQSPPLSRCRKVLAQATQPTVICNAKIVLGKEFPVVSSLQKQLGRLCFSVSNGCSIGALIEEVRFAADSPLEGDGFEPSVPRKMGYRFETVLSPL